MQADESERSFAGDRSVRVIYIDQKLTVFLKLHFIFSFVGDTGGPSISCAGSQSRVIDFICYCSR